MLMAKKTVLVTGASGNVGKATLKELGKYANTLDVRAGTRDPVKNAALKDLAPNVTVVAADSQNLKDAMAGVDYVFVIPPTCEDRAEIVEEVIKSAEAACVSLLLLLSIQIAPGTVFGDQFSKILAAAEASGIPTVIVNVVFYMDNLVHCVTLDQVKEHSCITEPLDGGVPHGEISVEDVGAVAAKILSDPSAHVGKTYPICAPPFSVHDVTSALSKLLGRTIGYKQMSVEKWRSDYGGLCPKWMMDGMADLYKLLDAGSPIMNPADGPSNVQKVLGRPAITIEEFLKSKAHMFS